MRQALVVYGGWEGHRPAEVAALFQSILTELGFTVHLANTLDALVDRDLTQLHLIVPVWTMGRITQEQAGAVASAVAAGVGLAGCHGGMCDAFRECTLWHFITGGQFVAHPGDDGTTYTVHIHRGAHPIVEGIEDFTVTSEQYYMHVDPAIRVLASTRFPVAPGPHAANGPVDMPVVWTKLWGRGRVFYTSLGHTPEVLNLPPVRTLLQRGCAWAAAGKEG